MDNNAVARELKEIQVRFDACLKLPIEQVRLGGALITIDPTSVSPYPSSNRNRVQYFGVDETVTVEQVDAIIALFRARGVERFHFWVCPGPQAEEIEAWLKKRKLKRFGGTGYPTLVRTVAAATPPHQTDLKVRRVTRAALDKLPVDRAAMFGESPDESIFLSTLGRRGFDHFFAFDGKMPVAFAMLCSNGRLGYLCHGFTLESHRNKGAQSALIRARIARAAEREYTVVASETLYLLQTSLHNLERAGFEIAYEKKVWVWTA